MSTGRKFLFLISFLIIDVLLICGIFTIRTFSAKNILKLEINALSELDFTADRYNRKVKSTGEYAIVESAIKKYLNDYAMDVQTLLYTRYNNELYNIQDVSKYDDNDFSIDDSIFYIAALKNKFNYDVDNVINNVTEESIYNYISIYHVSDSNEIIYRSLLAENNLIEKINKTQVILSNERIRINSYIDGVYNLGVFLRDNKSSYEIVNDEIVFNNTDVQNAYFKLVNKIKRIYLN